MRASLPLALAVFILLLAGCATETSKPARENLALTPVSFDDLPGWSNDHVRDAIPALQKSCTVFLKKAPDASLGIAGQARDWQPVCASLQSNPPQDDAAARDFFMRTLQPYRVSGHDGSDGLFTGYYEAELRGSPIQTGIFQVPLYAKPDDLITADLSAFRTEWKGQHIVGKVDNRKFVPYDARDVIAQGSLANRAQPLLWVDDKIDAFFLEIQGSGRIHMTDGTTIRVGYDATNGRAFIPIGRTLANDGEIPRPVTMPAVRAWLKAHPDRAQNIMNQNRSYIFFRRIDNVVENEGPIGAAGLSLTPLRSIAVDPAFIPLGLPLWLDTADGTGNKLQRLMVAQDTGGAIKGAVRGDFFWGNGAAAEAEAGAMQSHGSYYALIPKTVIPNVHE